VSVTIKVIFRSGVFVPLQPIIGIPEHCRVTIAVTETTPARPLTDWKGGLSDEDAAEMLKTIEQEFGKVEENHWR